VEHEETFYVLAALATFAVAAPTVAALRDLVFGSAATENSIATAILRPPVLVSMDMTVAGIAAGIIAMATVT